MALAQRGAFQMACKLWGAGDCKHSWLTCCEGNTREIYSRVVLGTTEQQIGPLPFGTHQAGCTWSLLLLRPALPQVRKPQPCLSVLYSSLLPTSGALQEHPMLAANNPESLQ